MNQAIARDSAARESIHALIDLQAQHNPHAPAIFCQGTSLSYGELVGRADILALHLLKAGVKAQTLVGLCVERSVDMIVGLLAILKAGGAFVPLDPAYPADRLAFMIADSQAPIVVAQTATQAKLTRFEGTTIVLDAMNVSPVAPEEILLPPVHANQLAYVVYTSGSTGRPKGVMIEHGSVVSFLAWTRSRFSAAQMSRVLCSSSLSFDVSFFEIFAPLAAGGAVVIIRDALELLTNKLDEPITTMCAVASALAELVRAKAIPPSVTTILQAGEYLPQALAHDIYATSQVRELINLCGATEDTIYSVSYDVPREPLEDPPIGLPFFERSAYILDEEGRPAVTGTPGEIYYAGTGVARGYHNRPELTAERFLPNPFGDSTRMYRSGDIVVEGDDGKIRYLRRDDQQVKISGHRIEIGEVEAVLREHPGVGQVAVLACELAGTKVLAAYAVERAAGSLDVSEALAFVAARLPAYMVPATLVLVDAMPYGPSGKLDRKGLEQLQRRRPELAQVYLAPRNTIETKIAELITHLLGLDRVGIRDNFFALGGQSLLVARLVAEVRAAFPTLVGLLDTHAGQNSLLTAFFVDPTIESLALALALADPETTTGVESVRCVQKGDPDTYKPLFLFHGVIRGEAFYVWNLAQSLGPAQPLYALAPHGYQGESVPETIEEMAQHYLLNIREIQPRGPYHLAGYCNGGLVAFEIARLLKAQGESVASLVVISASASNIRFAKLHAMLEKIKIIPGCNDALRRALFLRARGRLIALEHRRPGWNNSLGSLFRVMRPSVKSTDFAAKRKETTRAQRDERRYHAFLKAIDAYVPQKYDGMISLIWGDADSYASPDDPYNGWKAVGRNVDLLMVPGDHNFLESQPDLVADHVRRLIGHPAAEALTVESN